jgi:hypothetical protein
MEGDINMWIDETMKWLALDALLLELEGQDIVIEGKKIS